MIADLCLQSNIKHSILHIHLLVLVLYPGPSISLQSMPYTRLPNSQLLDASIHSMTRFNGQAEKELPDVKSSRSLRLRLKEMTESSRLL